MGNSNQTEQMKRCVKLVCLKAELEIHWNKKNTFSLPEGLSGKPEAVKTVRGLQVNGMGVSLS